MPFTSLPAEIVVQVFSYLDLAGIITVKAVSSYYRDIILNSCLLQYIAGLEASGLQDELSEYATIDLQQKLRCLRAHDEAWRILSTEHMTRAIIKHAPSSIYDLSGGVYVLGETTSREGLHWHPIITNGLRYVDLASITVYRELRVLFNRDWRRFEVGSRILDMGFALQEHDLVALIASVGPEHGYRQLQLQLKHFSTGTDHPCAAVPVIDIEGRSPAWLGVSVMLEISGPLLLLLLVDIHQQQIRDRLYLYNWMSGDLLVKESAPNRTWKGFAFLSPFAAVVPNLPTGTLEVFHLSYSEEELKECRERPLEKFTRVRALALPQRHPLCEFMNVAIRSDPNPFGDPNSFPMVATEDGTSTHVRKQSKGRACLPRAFSARPDRAIVLFECIMGIHFPQQHERASFTFIAHRSAILRLAYMHHYGADLETKVFTSNNDQISVVPWEEWGPAHTRWMDMNDVNSARWITTTAGQRQAVMRGSDIYVRDYNPYEVRRVSALLETGGIEENNWIVTKRTSFLESTRFFVVDIESSLPYVEFPLRTSIANRNFYDDVMLDEERVIGIVVDEFTHVVKYIDIYPYNTPILPKPSFFTSVEE